MQSGNSPWKDRTIPESWLSHPIHCHKTGLDQEQWQPHWLSTWLLPGPCGVRESEGGRPLSDLLGQRSAGPWSPSSLHSLNYLPGQQLTSAPLRGQSKKEQALMLQVCVAESALPGDTACFTDKSQDFHCCPGCLKMLSAWAPARDLTLETLKSLPFL